MILIDKQKGRKQMDLLTEHQIALLTENSRSMFEKEDKTPIVHISTMGKKQRVQWLISELDEDDCNIGYGLTDMGDNQIKMGIIDLNLIVEECTKDVRLFNNKTFEANYSISVFKMVGDEFGRIVADDTGLERIFDIAQFKIYGA